MDTDDVTIELENNGIDDFLGDDSRGNSSTKVSFQLDTDGNMMDDLSDGIEVQLEEPPEVPPEVEMQEEEREPEPSGPQLKPKPEKDVKKDEDKKRKSRATQRIKEQNAQIKELKAALEGQNKQMQKLQSDYDETTSTYAKVELERLTSDAARLEADLKRAADEGDGEKIAKVTKQLIESQTHIKNLQNFTAKPLEKKEGAPPQTQHQATPELSQAAEDWSLGKEFIIDNDEYRELSVEQRKLVSPVRQEMANVARQLLQEGFSNADPIFYEEMDIRLGSKFNYYEALANDGLDALSYINSDGKNTSANDASGETEKPQKVDKSKNVPVKGPTRSSSPNSTSQKVNSNKVVITKGMHDYWKKHLQKHMTLQEYAQEIRKDQQRTKF